ncbi:hypothetical protein TH53_10315 [Pedobacter lusitanus]|uniref:VWA domain-containing protein n=1 Tax=Pedobacter lusitanus TaxID=1503925 RepID=A0A0D0GS32_9SPHI|nr:hypothetical protein [Pedobacter lusitanus]KIO77276.1 hypothetical protein TH53_10315 [Pedobacter lusitanus]
MSDHFNFYSFLAFTGCLAAGLFFAWLLYGKKSGLTRPVSIALAVIRAITLTLILWFLFAPLIRQVSYTLEKPIIIIAQDNSESVGAFTPAGFDSLQYRKNLQKLQADLSEKYQVKMYSFSDKVISGLDFSYKGKTTNAVQLISQLNDELMNKNVGAVIMATDGIFNRGGNPVQDLALLKAPVYTIALGDTIPKKDILISSVNVNDLVYLDNDFRMEVQVQAYQCNGAAVRLTVQEDGKKVFEQGIAVNAEQFLKNIPVNLKATKTGQHKYIISVSPVEKEVSVKNNIFQTLVEVIDERQKVLIAAAGPHPDLAVLKQAIGLNKHHEVSVILNDDLLKTDLKGYGLIILYQLPDNQFDANAFLTKVKAEKVPVWYITGAQSNLSRFNQVQQQVNFSGNTALQYQYSDVDQNLSVFDLSPASRKVIENFDPLQAPSGQFKVLGSQQVVLDQRNGKMKTDRPQLFFMNDNGRKTGYLIGEGLWKWKLSEARENPQTPVFNELIGKVVQYLSVKDDKRKFKVRPIKNTFEENDRVLLNATLYNDSYQPVNTPDVNFVLKDEKGKTYNFAFSRFESSYQLDAGILPPGNYSFVANTTLGNQRYQDKGSFFVNTLTAEFQQTLANHQLLYQLANQTNGKLYLPDQILKIKDDLLKSNQLKTLSYEDRKYEELINLKSLFILILILLSIEWFVRKRNSAL